MKIVALILVSLLLFSCSKNNDNPTGLNNSSGIITTIAGTGIQGYSGDGGLATLAEITSPNDVAVDIYGNIYIVADMRIRKISGNTGIITTVAGSATLGIGGDGGPATSAGLSYASSVAVDTFGNLYIAETAVNIIRKVTASTGIITTIAGDGTGGYAGDGGQAILAKLGNPICVALDDFGNIYIADQGNMCIRKITVSTGIITTIAGNGVDGYSGDGDQATLAELSHPISVAVDGLENIYITDSGNSRIRKITASTGIITTIAGNGVSGYSGDGGLASSAKIFTGGITVDTSGNVYIADGIRIRKIAASTSIISTLAGNGNWGYSGDGGKATLAEFNQAVTLDVDASGNIYISDRNNNRIRKVNK